MTGTVIPPYGDFLVCAVSTQLRQEVSGFDDVIAPSGLDFSTSGLKAASVIRLGSCGRCFDGQW